MLKLPDFKKEFEYENSFYWSSSPSRIAKIITHYELYKMVKNIPGAIVECGVFKGASLIRFATFRKLLQGKFRKKIIGFDTFDVLPKTSYLPDKKELKRHTRIAGKDCISKKQLTDILKRKKIGQSVELVEGDIMKTVPAYVKAHPGLKIALLNLDVDIYKPSAVILKYLYPRIAKGGVLLLDDYGVYEGETKAANEYFKDKRVQIKKMAFSATPSYIIKR